MKRLDWRIEQPLLALIAIAGMEQIPPIVEPRLARAASWLADYALGEPPEGWSVRCRK